MNAAKKISKDTRSLLIEALGVSEQIKSEYQQLKLQNDSLESLVMLAQDKLYKDR